MRVAVPIRLARSMDRENARWTDGFVKYRLTHSRWGSFVVVDAIFTKNRVSRHGWDFYLPVFFGAPFLTFEIPTEGGTGTYDALVMSANVCSPRGNRPIPIELAISSTGRVMSYPDGSQLSACTIKHDVPLNSSRSGLARRVGDDFEIQLYHHTLKTTVPLIRDSGHFRGSEWNLQGTRRLTNVQYVYFTTLNRIHGEDDLQRIAMASDGMILQRGMSSIPGSDDPVVEMEVYRSSTTDRAATLSYWVPVGAMSPQHLLKFSPPGDLAYYEAILPEVVRLGVKPGETLEISDDHVLLSDTSKKTFEYVICGDASTAAGLTAPYDEEDTDQIVHLEHLQAEDVFQFWKRNMNTNQVSSRAPEFRALEPRRV